MAKKKQRIEQSTEIVELHKRIKGDLYYESAFAEAIEKYRNMNEEEKKATKKGDDLDEIPTTDVENYFSKIYMTSSDHDEDEDGEESEEDSDNTSDDDENTDEEMKEIFGVSTDEEEAAATGNGD